VISENFVNPTLWRV